ncbi:class I SAM-dependent RNA methyltransferase [Candidatus Saccharibacteria bacterium]|nr:class I SAM-dependent RNA methyltransferase [Candidatus Saccharibacteria bacterium]
MIKIDKIIPGGFGLGTASDGRKGFFWNALPGEIVTDYDVTKNKLHYYEAIATRIDNPSPHRVSPRDPCYLSTSPWQIMNYDYELQQKQELVVEIFREHDIHIKTPEILTDRQDYYYRNKMEYALYWDNETNQIKLAFHQRGSHRKFPITQSSIERPEIFTRAQEIIDDLNKRGEQARKYQTLLLRCNQQGQVSGGLYENHQPHPRFTPLTDTILNYPYSYSPNGFFQINLPVYELVLQEIKKHINTDKVLDLYSGVGTIGLSVAKDKHLTLVEVDKFAFRELCKNIVDEDILQPTESKPAKKLVTTGATKHVRNGNVLGILAKSEEVLDHINSNQTVILDPPRAGCNKKLIDKLLEVKPPKIIYLSCNPATQARDIKLLLDKYQLDTVKTFNFFPHTPHIENLVILA